MNWNTACLVLGILLPCADLPAQLPGATQSPHGASMKRDCSQCHNTKDWTVDASNVVFNHQETEFPLTEAHRNVRCRACHQNLEFDRVGKSCSDCHTDFHQGRMGKDCEYCHTAGTWEDRRKVRENHVRTLFPLIGAHASAECEDCHGTSDRSGFAGTSTACLSCHREEYNHTADPDHRKAAFGENCTECHGDGAVSWKGASYRHSGSFPLTEGHAALRCRDCHERVYSGTSTDCFACHEADYRRALDPDHVTGRFPMDCRLCHTAASWVPSSFNHDRTSFPLTGAHRAAACTACHADNRYAGTPADCWSCHQKDYTGASDPNHAANSFDRDCLRCHTQSAWSPATFDHSTTAFPLTGAHRSISCTACHTSGYTSLPTDCWSCHQKDYNGASDPNHAANNFDRDCLRCHTQNAWSPSTFDHSTTAFPLTGAHRSISCMACHTSGYTSLPADCWSCHQKDYNSASDPNHAVNNFDRDCLRCHTQSAWSPSTFDHSTTAFPLTGAHVPLACQACHADGYTGTPRDCYFCHETDYNTTVDPNHRAAGFPLACQNCHSTVRWAGASFNHDASYFPIYSGSHARRWSACSDCHTNLSNYSVFSCTNCHAHSQAETNEDHDEVSGYRYNSNDCYRCHPRGIH
jgi:hypothetical protein